MCLSELPSSRKFRDEGSGFGFVVVNNNNRILVLVCIRMNSPSRQLRDEDLCVFEANCLHLASDEIRAYRFGVVVINHNTCAVW